MEIRVNPTRMELTKLKKRLKIAKRGHKLLKDKQDELIKKFVDLVKRNKELREQVEKELTSALRDFVMARAVMPGEVLEESLMYPVGSVDIEVGRKNIMSVIVPTIKAVQQQENKNIFSYGFYNTTGQLDDAITVLSGILPKLLELAEVEKTCQLMAAEIEKTRRRVNALEHIMIPQMTDKIKYITMKLDENERGNLTRLMKIKEMVMVEGRV
ncbi:V-type sodium ATPase subunit D [Koleobacter methoxysyntrophicus]|uniref:V-type ATP synthase subunit D n=1 Tax=Koleobacter methoxysyntrophicus TaxID=2751313 RepID=A0A8A0RKX3_9FIRM|nr:V-type ATP synthase subunit D [Koleobacter methoxysyntrophicus]NPV44329.1 V-type ATP synthase subunit D [Bacillota bacterium]QSQ09071.1 V-type sodium ATPase subunit D [Koleobacter methoxysyntrophicus]